MKTSIRSKAAMMGLLIGIVPACVRAEQAQTPNSTLKPDDIKVVSFEDLTYPALAQNNQPAAEGIVVVRIMLDNKGRVTRADALSGKEVLIPDSLSNAKKWRFEPNATKTAVIVYNFRIARGICKLASSFFTLDPPNLATITACLPVTATSNSTVNSQQAADVMVSDKDMEIVDYEDMRYPTLAASARISGVVVVQAKLNKNGEVTDASAIFGYPMLIPDSLTNVKKWRFRPNAKQLEVVVYYFRFPCNGLQYNSDQQPQFVLVPPNFATVTGTGRTVTD